MAADDPPAPRAYGRWMAGIVDAPTPSATRIRKQPRPGAPAPNVADYDAARRAFTWEAARAALDGLPGGRGLNIAHEAVDRHACGALAGKTALRWLGRRGERVELTYSELAGASSRFANLLDGLGVARGDRVFALAPRRSELYVAALGTLKHRCVFSPLFSAFGPDPVRERMAIGGARVLVTTPSCTCARSRRSVSSSRASSTCCSSGRPAMPASARGARPERRAGRRVGGLRDRAHRSAGPGPAALHERHDRTAEGCDARARGRRGPPRNGCHGPRPARRRRLLVHGGPGLGDGHLLRDDRSADPRPDDGRRRGGVRRRALVRDARARAGQRVVHGADRGADAHAPHRGGARARAISRRCASSRASASR